MNAPRTATLGSVDRALRQAGHQRQDLRHRYLNPSTGYVVAEGAGDAVDVTWSGRADLEGEEEYRHNLTALGPLATTLKDAGYGVRFGDHVYPADKYSDEFRWPCLIVNVEGGQQ